MLLEADGGWPPTASGTRHIFRGRKLPSALGECRCCGRPPGHESERAHGGTGAGCHRDPHRHQRAVRDPRANGRPSPTCRRRTALGSSHPIAAERAAARRHRPSRTGRRGGRTSRPRQHPQQRRIWHRRTDRRCTRTVTVIPDEQPAASMPQPVVETHDAPAPLRPTAAPAGRGSAHPPRPPSRNQPPHR